MLTIHKNKCLLLFISFLKCLQVNLLLFVTFCWFLLEFIYRLFTSYFKLNIFCINILFYEKLSTNAKNTQI